MSFLRLYQMRVIISDPDKPKPKNICHKDTKDKFINLTSCLGVLVAIKKVLGKRGRFAKVSD